MQKFRGLKVLVLAGVALLLIGISGCGRSGPVVFRASGGDFVIGADASPNSPLQSEAE